MSMEKMVIKLGESATCKTAKKISDLNQAALDITTAVEALYAVANGDTAVYAIIDALNAQKELIHELRSKIEASIPAAFEGCDFSDIDVFED